MRALFQDTGFFALKKGIEAYKVRQTVIAHNLSNITTPRYRALRVEFEEILRQRLQAFKIRGKRTHPRHIPCGRVTLREIANEVPKVGIDRSPIPPGRINNVNVDKEITQMAMTGVRWDAAVQLLNYKYKKLMSAITGR